ncbi:MFS transporter [Micromonospora sp. NPDC049559]|uniref:MFS transporter n=1 Tax=Micromonospora sp. NPDC049559 TaxID=3155923 RepID=UPI00344947DB
MTTPLQSPPVAPARANAALVVLGVATFSYVTVEVLPIGLLTVIAADLGRTESQVGLLVTGYAAVVVLASLPLTRLTYRLPRRRLLAATFGVLAAATLVSALAPSYPVLMASRLVVAASQALFWSVAPPTVTGLFPPAVRGRVVARLAIGTALAPVLGIPAGTWLGQQAGWRTSFAVLAGIGALLCAAVAVLLPERAATDGGLATGSTPDRRGYAVLVAGTAIGVTGFLTFNTYVTPFLLDVGGFAPTALGPLLLVSGVGALAGTLAVGTVLDRRPRAALMTPLVLLTGALLGLYALGWLRPVAVAVLAVCGLSFSALAVAVQNRTLQIAPGSLDLASAGVSSAFNVGIAAGALLGGALVDQLGIRSVALAGGVLTALALAILLAEPWLPRRLAALRPATGAATPPDAQPVG